MDQRSNDRKPNLRWIARRVIDPIASGHRFALLPVVATGIEIAGKAGEVAARHLDPDAVTLVDHERWSTSG